MVLLLVLWIFRKKKEAAILPWSDVLSASRPPPRLMLRPEGGSPGDEDMLGLRVAVIGAGIAGCTAARLLAQHGARVTVFEREATVGGRTSSCTRLVGRWKARLESGMDCVTSGSVALAEAAALAGLTEEDESPVDDFTYTYTRQDAKNGVVLRGRNVNWVLQMGAALHIVNRLRLLYFWLACKASGQLIDPMDPLNMCLPHSLIRTLPSAAALADTALGISARSSIVDALARSMFHVNADQLPPAYLLGMLGGFGMANRWKPDLGMSQIVEGLVGLASPGVSAEEWAEEEHQAPSSAGGTRPV
jgi:hypothetical protein